MLERWQLTNKRKILYCQLRQIPMSVSETIQSWKAVLWNSTPNASWGLSQCQLKELRAKLLPASPLGNGKFQEGSAVTVIKNIAYPANENITYCSLLELSAQGLGNVPVMSSGYNLATSSLYPLMREKQTESNIVSYLPCQEWDEGNSLNP